MCRSGGSSPLMVAKDGTSSANRRIQIVMGRLTKTEIKIEANQINKLSPITFAAFHSAADLVWIFGLFPSKRPTALSQLNDKPMMQLVRSLARAAASFKNMKPTLVIAMSLLSGIGIVTFLSRGIPTAIPVNRCLRTTTSSPVVDWRSADVNTMKNKQIMNYFQWSNASSCRLAQYFGGVTFLFGIDGQKAVCMDPEIMPLPGKCIVYSFGISNDWSFEEMIDRYGCDVYAFDPSLNLTDHERKGSQIHFFNLGLSYREETFPGGWHVQTLSGIYDKLQSEKRHSSDRIIDYVKIDIEEDEWTALVDILHSGMLRKVRQLAIEIHLPLEGNISSYRRLVSLLRSMEEQHGMVRFDSKINAYSEGNIKPLFGMMGYASHEIAWYNHKLKRKEQYYNE